MSDELELEEPIEEEETGPDGRLKYRIIGFAFITAALLLAVYGIVAFSAWQQGQDLRAEKAQTALEEDLNNQLILAREDGDAGNYPLALRRLEWVLSRDPDFTGVEELLEEVQNILNLTLTPSPTATPPATPEIIDVQIGPDPAESFAELERYWNFKLIFQTTNDKKPTKCCMTLISKWGRSWQMANRLS